MGVQEGLGAALIFHPRAGVRRGAPSPVVWPRSLIPHPLVISITKPGAITQHAREVEGVDLNPPPGSPRPGSPRHGQGWVTAECGSCPMLRTGLRGHGDTFC